MRYLKLFKEMKIEYSEFPFEGNGLSPREKKILTDLVGSYLNYFKIKVEDHFYYTQSGAFLNIFNELWEVKDYLLFRYYLHKGKPEEILKLLKTSKLDPSFDINSVIKWAGHNYRRDIITLLTNDPRVSDYSIGLDDDKKSVYKEIIEFLLKDPRVRDKLSEWEINKFTDENFY